MLIAFTNVLPKQVQMPMDAAELWALVGILSLLGLLLAAMVWMAVRASGPGPGSRDP